MKKIIIAFLLSIPVLIANAQDEALHAAGDYIFFPGNEISIPPKATVTLSIKQIINDAPSDVIVSSEQWTIDGKELSNQSNVEGNFKLSTLQLDKGTYTAPANVPPHNPVVITLSFQPTGQKEKIILYCRIHIIDKENYFYLNNRNSSGGTLYELKESPIPSFRKSRETANYVNDQWNIGANGFQKTENDNNSTQFIGIGVSIVGNGTGIYKWTVNGNDKTGLKPPCNTVTVSGTGKNGSPFQYMSADCVPHGDDNCKLTALEGNTVVSVFDKKNKIMKGYFSGILISATHHYVFVSGAFSVFVQ
jgi:hypothetical protein